MMDIDTPQLHGDTLTGFDKNGGFMESPIGSVELMRAPMAAVGRTALLAATLAVGTALVIAHLRGNVDTCVRFTPGAGNDGLPVACGAYGGGGSGNVVGF